MHRQSLLKGDCKGDLKRQLFGKHEDYHSQLLSCVYFSHVRKVTLSWTDPEGGQGVRTPPLKNHKT